MSWSITDGVELISNSGAIDGPEEQTNITLTTAVSERTLTSQDTKYVGDWLATITGKDRTDQTCTAEVVWESYMPDGEGVVGFVPPEGTTTALLIIGAVALGAYFLLKKK